jgi:hypothetical protein
MTVVPGTPDDGDIFNTFNAAADAGTDFITAKIATALNSMKKILRWIFILANGMPNPLELSNSETIADPIFYSDPVWHK